MSARIRTGYSFRSAVGGIGDVIARLKQTGATHAPITDTASAFGWVKWRKAALKAGLEPVYGVELAVSPSRNEKKPSIDHWTFIAKDSILPLNRLISLATDQFRYQPVLSLEQGWGESDVNVIMGHRTKFSAIAPADHIFVGLSPSMNKGQVKNAVEAGHKLIAASDNRYPAIGGQGLYETICGRNASPQSYPQWIMGDDEWGDYVSAFATPDQIAEALINRGKVFAQHKATLAVAEMVHPARPATLEEMCREGARLLKCDLTRPDYAARLEKELSLISEKGFEDYFYLVADICQWARAKMIVGPARGSSCGSLVCYLLRITTVDPIPYGLIFERFIDINRSDLPDIDIDFPEHRRTEVFAYVEKKYGKENVARLGTVAMYQPRSALKEAAGAMDIAPWLLNPVMDAIIERSAGDSRALQATEDTLRDTEAGREFLAKYPEILIAAKMEGHPRHSGQHAAGIVITQEPIGNYVPVDRRTGAIMCDKKDAEELNLLKIDALGLTQLSIFEKTLELAKLPRDHLFSVPLDDAAAIDVLNQKKYAGIFQFNGLALQSVTDHVTVKGLNDIVAITALGRPGPLSTGGTDHWIKVHVGREPETYPHPLFKPYLKDTLGVVAYQEQVMNIGREIGDLSWEDVTALRKAMSKSLGKEFFDQYGDKWKAGAREKGIPEEVLTKVWDDLCLSGDTTLLNPFPAKGRHKKLTLRALYERGGLGPADGWHGAKRRRQSLLMYDGDALKPYENLGVSYSGQKETFTILTKSGNSIRATADHKFFMPSGEYARLKELRVGDFVMSDAGKITTKRKAQKGSGSGGHNWWHKLKADLPNYEEGKRYLHAMFKKCQHCHERPYEETHHLNGDHEDHAIDNLLPVCRICHKKLRAAMDGGYHKAWEKGHAIFPDEIVSIESYGMEDVYDVHMPAPHHNFLADGIVVHNCAYGSWAFNLSHALAYGLVSYYCCWLKAHYPLEFAAATLTYTDSPETQIKLLRELATEGVEYIAADLELSTTEWTVKKGEGWNHLVGPLDNVLGVGPKMMEAIEKIRHQAQQIHGKDAAALFPEMLRKAQPRAHKLLLNAKTKIDSLYPIRETYHRCVPDPKAINIISTPVNVRDVQKTGRSYEVMVVAVFEQIKPKDENEDVKIAKRGGRRLTGPTKAINLRIADDTDVMLGKVTRFDYERIGTQIMERGRAGKAVYAIKGSIPDNFRILTVKQIKYIGDLEKGGGR